jgi:uncharacterized protein YfdQ (DUF2303 family)
LELARKFEAQKKVSFSSDIRLNNGDIQLTYQEATEAKAKGQIAFPSEFTLGISVLHGGAAYEVKCNLRYKLSDGRLGIWYDIVREQALIDAAFQDLLQVVRETKVPLFHGTAQNMYDYTRKP